MEVESINSDIGERDTKRHCKGETASDEVSSYANKNNDSETPASELLQPSSDMSKNALGSSGVNLMPPPASIPKKRVEDIPSFGHFGRSFYETKTEKDAAIRARFGFRVGNVVKWTRCDNDVPEGAWGFVKGFTADRVRVAFPLGSWQFPPQTLFCIGKAKFADGWEVGDLVKLADGGIGEILGYFPASDKLRVKVSDKTANYSSRQLLHIKRNENSGLAQGDIVTWSSADVDVPEGTEGTVLGFADAGVCVGFSSGTWAFQIAELIHVGQSRFGFVLGDSVQWVEADEDVPLGDRGEVVGFIPHRQLVTVKFGTGRFNFLPSKLVRVNESVVFGFSAGDIVLWRNADEDIPKGTRGIVTGFTYDQVRAVFRQRSWNFFPHKLQKYTMANGSVAPP